MELSKEAKSNTKFITNNHKTQALFKEFLGKENNLKLLRPRYTQFGTNFVKLQNLQKVKTSMQQMITNDKLV